MIIFLDSKIYRYLTFASIIYISTKIIIITFLVDSKILELSIYIFIEFIPLSPNMNSLDWDHCNTLSACRHVSVNGSDFTGCVTMMALSLFRLTTKTTKAPHYWLFAMIVHQRPMDSHYKSFKYHGGIIKDTSIWASRGVVSLVTRLFIQQVI